VTTTVCADNPPRTQQVFEVVAVTRTSTRTAARSSKLLSRKSQPVTVHLRKMYIDCRFGQLHLHTAFPSSGGFDELTPLICIVPAPLTGRVFKPLLATLGKDRSVYAPDMPGSGESDAPTAFPTLTDYAAGLVDLLDSLRLRQVDVLGYQAGSLAALELALARPTQVRKVMMVGIPLPDSNELESGKVQSINANARDKQLLQGYPARQRLPLMHQTTLVLRQKDELWESTARAENLLRDASLVELPEGQAALEGTAADLLAHTREFLDP